MVQAKTSPAKEYTRRFTEARTEENVVKSGGDKTALRIQREAPALVGGKGAKQKYPMCVHVLMGGTLQSELIFCQLAFTITHELTKGDHPVRYSYTRLAERHFPFIGRRQVIRHIDSLVKDGLLSQSKTVGEINEYGLTAKGKLLYATCIETNQFVFIFPSLVRVLKSHGSLLGAFLLQSIHMRGRKIGGYTASYAFMYREFFPYCIEVPTPVVSWATFMSTMKKLIEGEFLFSLLTKHHEDDPDSFRPRNTYILNYEKLETLYDFHYSVPEPGPLNDHHPALGYSNIDESWYDKPDAIGADRTLVLP